MCNVHTATEQWTLPMEPERYEPLKHPITNQNFRHTCGHCGAGYRASFSIPATASSTVTCVVPATTQLHACNACIFKFPPHPILQHFARTVASCCSSFWCHLVTWVSLWKSNSTPLYISLSLFISLNLHVTLLQGLFLG